MANTTIDQPGQEPQTRIERGRKFARMLAGSCTDCGASGMEVELYPVGDDHLTFFGGDELCEECALNHGVL